MSFVLLGILNSQAAGAGNIPASLNPDLWLDASDASTITESGGSVSQWDNKGSKSNFVQATAASQPSTGSATQNGLNVLSFNQDFLEQDGSLDEYKFLHDGTKYFYAMAYSYSATAVMGIFGSTPIINQSANGAVFNIDNRSNANEYGYYVTSTTAGGRIMSVEDPGFLSPSFSVTSAITDSDAAAADRHFYFDNNTQGPIVNSASGAVSTGNQSFSLKIGSDGNSSFLITGEIAEFIIVSGEDATETNRQAVVNYLNDKWSLF